MQQVNIVQRKLSGLEDNVHRLRFVEFAAIQFLRQRDITRSHLVVALECAVFVRAANHAQTTVLRGRIIHRQPHRASRQRADRPVLAILMPRRALAIASRLGKKAHVPEREVAADQLLDQVEDVAIGRRIPESQVIVKQRGAVVAKFGVRLQQLVVTRLDGVEHLGRHLIVGDDVAVFVVLGDLISR